MADEVVLAAEARADRGTAAAKRLRSQGRLPGVIYGSDIDTHSVAVDRHELIRAMHAHGAHPLVTLKLDGDEYLALVKEVQVDPVRLEALHVDFLRVREDVAVHTQVALELTGTPAGVKEGGILETQLTTLNIEALPRAIPEVISLDVSHLAMNEAARVADIVPPEGVRILDDSEETVASVTAPRVEELEVVAEEIPGEELPEVAQEGEEAPAEEPGEEAGGAEE